MQLTFEFWQTITLCCVKQFYKVFLVCVWIVLFWNCVELSDKWHSKFYSKPANWGIYQKNTFGSTWKVRYYSNLIMRQKESIIHSRTVFFLYYLLLWRWYFFRTLFYISLQIENVKGPMSQTCQKWFNLNH